MYWQRKMRRIKAITPFSCQSAFAPESFTTRAHTLASSATNAAKSSGDFETATSVPPCASVAPTAGLRAAAAVASKIRLTL
jgi:hypothetical protein